MVAHTCNSRAQEAKAGATRVPDQLGRRSDFQARLSYKAKSCLKKQPRQVMVTHAGNLNTLEADAG